MEGLPVSIPRRLYFLRVIVTVGIFVSFFLSLNLWGGERFFPSKSFFENITLKPPFDFALVICSGLFLLCSLFFTHTRIFIFLSLTINLLLVLFDINRLQPWFYIYNAILIVFLFYDGRVDNSNKFTSIFILIQLIVSGVYVYNGLSQLFNANFINTDFYDVIIPLKRMVSERQFAFCLKMGKAVPCLIIFVGVGLLIKPVKYLAVSLGLIMHFLLLILLFPSPANSNYSLWFMNIVFGGLIVFLFSGKTQPRYFSISVLFQKPVFYIILFSFWILPVLNYKNHWHDVLSFNFKSGSTGKEKILITGNTYNYLPLYIKSFCTKCSDGYNLRVDKWCRAELRSEYYNQKINLNKGVIGETQMVTTRVDVSDDELSIK